MKVEMDVISSILKTGDWYLDPGSGSFILQILLAALLGSAFAIKMYWRKIKAFITRKPLEESQTTGDDEEE